MCCARPKTKQQLGQRCTVSLSSGIRNGTKLHGQRPTRQQQAAASIGRLEQGSLKWGQGKGRQRGEEEGKSHEGTTVEGWGAGCVWLGCHGCLVCDKSVSAREQGLLKSRASKKEKREVEERTSVRVAKRRDE